MSDRDTQLRELIDRQRDSLVELTVRLCAIPSISASPEYRAGVESCARMVAQEALNAGFQSAEIFETPGSPVVVARYVGDPANPTVLVYTHYDVQPANDVERWSDAPFEPTVRDGAIWARGAADDKGHIAIHLKAVEALLEMVPVLPVNLVFVSEGEEESGSPNFDAFVESQDFGATLAVISDTPGFIGDQPTLTTSLRGLVLVDVVLEGAAEDAHSGIFGGAIRNPAEELARLISQLKDPVSGRILVPGFYDDVVEQSADSRAAIASLPFDESAWFEALGEPVAFGEEGWTSLERTWRRPTLEINSFGSGDPHADVNTIVPSSARARLSCRIVPNQNSSLVGAMVRTAIEHACPPGMRVHVRVREAAEPVGLDDDSSWVRLASSVIEKVTDKQPILVGMGGSVPPVASLSAAGLPCLLIGVADDADNFHARDEHIAIDRLMVGVEIVAQLWLALGSSTAGADGP